MRRRKDDEGYGGKKTGSSARGTGKRGCQGQVGSGSGSTFAKRWSRAAPKADAARITSRDSGSVVFPGKTAHPSSPFASSGTRSATGPQGHGNCKALLQGGPWHLCILKIWRCEEQCTGSVKTLLIGTETRIWASKTFYRLSAVRCIALLGRNSSEVTKPRFHN